jgi:hypothetical protein
MPKKRKKIEDTNEAALRVVAQATGEVTAPVIIKVVVKDPLAVELGRRGGLKGGVARAANLSPERKKEIAAKGAAARWGQRKK